MPPASLPALAAIRPGPSRPRNAKRRVRRGLSRAGRRGRPRVADRIRRMTDGTRTAIELTAWSLHRAAVYSVAALEYGCALSVLAEQTEAPAPATGQHRLEHIVDGDDPEHPLALVDDRDRSEVVVGHLSRDLLEGRVGCETGGLVLDDRAQLATGLGAQQRGHGDAAFERAVGGADEDGRKQLGRDLAALDGIQRVA